MVFIRRLPRRRDAAFELSQAAFGSKGDGDKGEGRREKGEGRREKGQGRNKCHLETESTLENSQRRELHSRTLADFGLGSRFASVPSHEQQAVRYPGAVLYIRPRRLCIHTPESRVVRLRRGPAGSPVDR